MVESGPSEFRAELACSWRLKRGAISSRISSIASSLRENLPDSLFERGGNVSLRGSALPAALRLAVSPQTPL